MKKPENMMKIYVRGTVYANVRECAKALGVSPSTVYVAVSLGREETLGLGRGMHNGHMCPTGKGLTVAGKFYPSMRFLSLELGHNSHYVTKTIRRYGMDRAMEIFLGKIMAKERRKEKRELHRQQLEWEQQAMVQ